MSALSSVQQLVSAHVVLLITYPTLRIAPDLLSLEEEGSFSGRQACVASPWAISRTKRVFDFAVAAAALLFLTPLFAVCWVMVRLSSPGPVFFGQFRMGRNGKVFAFHKFRSMRTGHCANLPSHTAQNDPRITKAGRFLRRYKLDELPQFWNVLKGDMSLVGPRPKLPEHEGLFMSYRPGITGQATLAFRNEEQMLLEVPSNEIDRFYEEVLKPIKAELDIEYMQSATLGSDLRILWRTFNSCLHCGRDSWQELTDILSGYAAEAGQDGKWTQISRALAYWLAESPPSPEVAKSHLAGGLDDAL